jgi:transposase
MRRASGCSGWSAVESLTTTSVIRYRRAMVVLASAGGNSVPVIARLVAAEEDTVREVIHRFNELGMRALDPHWAGGRPRQISAEDEAFLVETARTRPRKLGCPFTHWSVRKLIGYLADNPHRVVHIGRERARRLLLDHEISFQQTKTWKESTDPDRDAKLAGIEQVINDHPDRTFAFDEFGPLACVPTPGACWAPKADRSGWRPTTARPPACGSSKAATPLARTGCGAWPGTARVRPTPWRRCARSASPARTGTPST